MLPRPWQAREPASTPASAASRSSPRRARSSSPTTTPTPRWRRSRARAGVTTGLVNHYFGTKRELYLAVVADLASGLPEMVEHRRPRPRRSRSWSHRNMDRFLDAVRAQPRGHRRCCSATEGGLGRDPEVARSWPRPARASSVRMAVNHAGGEDPSPELLLALRVFQGAAEAAAAEWLRSGRATREEVHAVADPDAARDGRRSVAAVAGGAAGSAHFRVGGLALRCRLRLAVGLRLGLLALRGLRLEHDQRDHERDDDEAGGDPERELVAAGEGRRPSARPRRAGPRSASPRASRARRGRSRRRPGRSC